MNNESRKEIIICVTVTVIVIVGMVLTGIVISKIDHKEIYLRQFSLELQIRMRGCNGYKVPGVHYREILKNCISHKSQTNSTQRLI